MLDRAADGDGGDDDEQSREGALKTGSSHRMAAAVVLVLCVVLGAHALVWRVTKTRAFVAGHVITGWLSAVSSSVSRNATSGAHASDGVAWSSLSAAAAQESSSFRVGPVVGWAGGILRGSHCYEREKNTIEKFHLRREGEGGWDCLEREKKRKEVAGRRM